MSDYNLKSGCTYKSILETEKTLKTLSSGQINIKKQKTKKFHWAGYFKINPDFFQPCLVAVVLLGEEAERGFNDPAAQAQHEVQGGLLLDVVVGEGAPVLQLLTGEDETLLVGGNPLLILHKKTHVLTSVPDPEVLGPPGSGPVIICTYPD